MPQAGRLLRARPAAVRELWVWLVVIVVSVVPTVARYPRRYWFYDEWSIIDRVQSGGNGWGAIFDSFNGHLVAVSYLTYRAQLAVSDLDDRYVVYGVFVASLVAIHLALAVLFRTAGVPALPSVLAGGVLTYLGRGSQSAVFEVQLSFNGATAGAVAAVAIALGPGSMRRAIASAALVVGALFFDSGVAAIALLPLIVLTAGRWRWWQTALAVGPGTALAGWWTVASGSRPSAPSTLADQAEVAARLLVDGLGAMVGGPTTAGAGVLVVLAGLAVAVAVRPGLRSRLDATLVRLLLAGVVTAVAVAVLIAKERGGILQGGFRDYNRYLQMVATWAAVGLLPAAWALAVPRPGDGRPRPAPTGRVLTASAAVLVAFVAGLPAFGSYQATFESWNEAVRVAIAESVAVLDRGCPAPGSLQPTGRPAGALSPHADVRLLVALHAAGELGSDRSVRPTPAVETAMCVPQPPP
jgi:hypothetical protein